MQGKDVSYTYGKIVNLQQGVKHTIEQDGRVVALQQHELPKKRQFVAETTHTFPLAQFPAEEEPPKKVCCCLVRLDVVDTYSFSWHV